MGGEEEKERGGKEMRGGRGGEGRGGKEDMRGSENEK